MSPRLLCSLLCTLVLPSAAAQTILFQISGSASDQDFGIDAEPIGDVNADGFVDFAVADHTPTTTQGSEGHVRIYSGRTGTVLGTAQAGNDEIFFGEAIAGIGDVNGDSIPDIVVASLNRYSSQFGLRLTVLSGADASTVYALNTGLDAQNVSVSGVGDQNGDSIPDILVGAPFEDGISGRVDVRSGADGTVIRFHDGVHSNGHLGHRVLGLEDVTGDGIHDYAVTELNAYSTSNNGAVRVHSGADGSVVFQHFGTAMQQVGLSLVSIGDINGDGLSDLAVGAASATNAFRVISASDGSLLAQADDMSGMALARNMIAAGDYDNDGVFDFAAADSFASNPQGNIVIYRGDTATEIARVSTLATSEYRLQSSADINGDGFVDLLIRGSAAGPGELIVLSRAVPNGGVLCLGLPNSTGLRGIMTASSASQFTASANDVVLSISQLPPNVLGIPALSRQNIVGLNPVNSMGRICIAGQGLARARNLMFQTDTLGGATVTPDLTMIPQPGMAVAAVPGDTFNFQCWHRDTVGGMSTTNFTDAVTITFQ